MRIVQFLQVVALVALVGYTVLLQLENPLQVRLPLPGGLVWSAPLGVVLGGAVLLGALYASLLYVPLLVRAGVRRRRDARHRRELEERLSATLQAKLSGADRGRSPDLDGPDGGPDLPEVTAETTSATTVPSGLAVALEPAEVR